MNSITLNSTLGAQNFTRISEKAIQTSREGNIKEEPISYKETPNTKEIAKGENEEVKFKKFFDAYDSHLSKVKNMDWGLGGKWAGNALAKFMKKGDTIDLAHIKGAKIYLDLNGDGKFRDSEKLTLAQLANLDTNNDGILSKSDKFFKDIKIEFEGSDKEKKVISLGGLVDTLNLADYFDENEIKHSHKLIEEQRQMLKRAKQDGTSGLGLSFEDDKPIPQKIDARKTNGGGFFFQETTWWHNSVTDQTEKRTNAYDSRRAIAGLNPFAGINNNETFKAANEDKISALFKKAGVKQGEWLDLKGTEALGINSDIFNLGYEKIGANNERYIQKFNAQKRFGDSLYDGRGMHDLPDISLGKSAREKNYYHNTFNGSNKQSYEEILNKEFERWDKGYKNREAVRMSENSRLYNEMKELGLNEENLKLIERFGEAENDLEFTSLTGMSFNKENVKVAREAFEKGDLVATFADIDVVEAIKQDEDGGYILKFDSGRMVKVKELFYQNEETMKIEQQTSKLNTRTLEMLMEGKSLKEYRA